MLPAKSIPIACNNCSRAKARCDKQAPCSRCTRKRISCEPRTARRSHNLVAQDRGHELRALVASPQATDSTNRGMIETGSPDVSNDSVGKGYQRVEADDFTVMQELLDLDMSDMTDVVDPALMCVDFANGTSQFDTLIGSWAELPPYSPDFPVDNFSIRWGSSTAGGGSMPAQIIDHPSIVQAQQRWLVFQCNPQNTTTSYPSIAAIHMEGLEEILCDGCQWLNLYSWQDQIDPSPQRRITIEAFKSSHRETLLAIAPLLLSKARTVHVDLLTTSSANGSSGAASPTVVVLPQTSILDRLLRIYGNRFGPYHQLTFGSTLKPDALMNHSNSLVSAIPMLLMIAFGVSTIPTIDARNMASGLMEICRISLQDVIEKNLSLTTDTRISQCALLFLTLGIWSGDKYHMDLAMAQRGMYIHMLRHLPATEFDQMFRPLSEIRGDPQTIWQSWKKQESIHRLKYTWVMMDQEWSLFHDTTLLFSLNDMDEPMPSDDRLWAAESETEWVLLMKKLVDDRPQFPVSLRNFYKEWVNPDAQMARVDVSPIILRLLLLPIQAQISSSREALRMYTSVDGYRNRSTSISQSLYQSQLDQIRSYLRKWYTLTGRCPLYQTTCSPLFCSSLVLYHLLALNTMASFLDIERIAREGPATQSCDHHSPAEMSLAWQNIFSATDKEEIWFHCGQLMRLYRIMPEAVQPLWWPSVVYRVVLVAWSHSLSLLPVAESTSRQHQKNRYSSHEFHGRTGRISPRESEHGAVFHLDALPPDDSILDRYLKFGEGDPMFSGFGGVPVSVRDPSGVFRYCLDALGCGSPGRLREGIQGKLEALAKRWGADM